MIAALACTDAQCDPSEQVFLQMSFCTDTYFTAIACTVLINPVAIHRNAPFSGIVNPVRFDEPESLVFTVGMKPGTEPEYDVIVAQLAIDGVVAVLRPVGFHSVPDDLSLRLPAPDDTIDSCLARFTNRKCLADFQ